jgi:hypothetical protein
MAGFIERDQCKDVIDALSLALEKLPTDARAVRARLKVMRGEYIGALRMYDRAVDEAEEDELPPEIRAVGSLEPGETIQKARALRVRRLSPGGGVCIFVDGRETWENFAGPTSPCVVIDREAEA